MRNKSVADSFREQFNGTLWPRALQIIEGMTGVAKRAA